MGESPEEMIRVIYRWRVTPSVAAAFELWWHHGTIGIRNAHPGAMGSLLLRSRHEPDLFVGVARWETERQLLDFRQQAAPMVFEGADLESVEVLDELDDLTLRG
jgi:heme-degrading monooxygenase HmoA